MSTQKKGQINVRLDRAKFDKLKALSRADNRSMSNYTGMIIEDFLEGRYRPRKRKKGSKYENQIEQINNK